MRILSNSVVLAALMSVSTANDGFSNKIKITSSNPTEENIMSLVNEVAGNYRYKYALSPEMLDLNEEARRALIEIPGHARYFVNRIEESRVKYTDKEIMGGYAYDYEESKGGFGSLAHLKSPEVVWECGKYLYDQRQDRKIKGPAYFDDTRPSLAVMASMVLFYSDIRDYPVKSEMEHRKVEPMKEIEYLMAPIEKSQVWWEEVKSGKRALSFIGEDVEYRFKPDGTWEKFPYTGPPDPPKVRESEAKPVSEVSKPAANPAKQDWEKHWPWLAGGVALLTAIIVWFRRTAKAA